MAGQGLLVPSCGQHPVQGLGQGVTHPAHFPSCWRGAQLSTSAAPQPERSPRSLLSGPGQRLQEESSTLPNHVG